MKAAGLARRLYTAEGLLLAVSLAAFGGLRWSLHERDAALRDVRLLTDYSRTVHWAGLSCRRYLDAVLGSRDPKRALQPLKEALDGLRRTGTAAGNLGLSEEVGELSRMRRFIEASGALLKRAGELESLGRPEEAEELYRTGLQPLAEEYLGRSLERRLREDELRRGRSLMELEGWTRGTFTLALATLATAFLLFGIWTRRFAHYVTKNLELSRRAVTAFASGNFAALGAPEHDDEVGRLTAALNEAGERLKHAQERLIRIERQAAFGQLANGAAHAINNPLAAVIGYTELLLRRDSFDKHDREDLQVIRDQARRCEAILLNLRQFTGHGAAEKKPVDLNEMLAKLLEFLRPAFDGAGIMVEARFESRLAKVSGSASELQQVFYNLLTNAAQALKGRVSPRITVTTWSEGVQVTVAVDDNGEGVAPEHQPRLFEPFFTTRPASEGLGLGLSSAFGIVKAHGGTIALRSERGTGTRAQVVLPALSAEGGRVGRVGIGGGMAGRVLVVDDEPEIMALVTRVLRREGLDVECAPGAADALLAVARRPFDLVLSDYRMPGMDGVQLYGELCSARPDIASRFVFSTGEIVSREFQGFADRNGLPVLLKPFDLDELVSVVRARLEVSRNARADA